jgi:copper(I)-binding protein
MRQNTVLKARSFIPRRKCMRRLVNGGVSAIGIAVFVSALVVTVQAGQKRIGGSNAWVKLPAAGETTATAFVEVDNPTMYDAYLVSAEADVAGKVVFRERAADGSTKDRPSVNVPAFESVSLGPDGVHLLLMDLKQPLKEGDTVNIKIATDSSAVIQVAAVVRKE